MNQELTIKAPNPKEFGLEESKAKQIRDMFEPMLNQMVELEKEYNEVIKLEINKETCLKAKELRNKYVKVRTGTDKVHKEMKAFYLAGGRFVDGWRNSQKMASEGIESKLMEIEKYYENIEKERLEKVRANREEQLSKYGMENIPDLSAMDEDAFQLFLNGTKIAYENKIKAEKEALELERQKELKAKLYSERKELLIPYWTVLKEDHKSADYSELSQDQFDTILWEVKKDFEAHLKEQEAIRLENERLKNEALERQRLAEIEAQKRAKEEIERKEKEKEEREAYALKIKSEREKIEKEERLKREKLEAELKAKEDAERKAKEDEKARIEAELKKGDLDKIKDLINDVNTLKTKYVFESESNKKLYVNVGLLFDKVTNYINEKTA